MFVVFFACFFTTVVFVSLVSLVVLLAIVVLFVLLSSPKFKSGASKCMNADATTPHSSASSPTISIIIIFEFVCALILSTLLFLAAQTHPC